MSGFVGHAHALNEECMDSAVFIEASAAEECIVNRFLLCACFDLALKFISHSLHSPVIHIYHT